MLSVQIGCMRRFNTPNHNGCVTTIGRCNTATPAVYVRLFQQTSDGTQPLVTGAESGPVITTSPSDSVPYSRVGRCLIIIIIVISSSRPRAFATIGSSSPQLHSPRHHRNPLRNPHSVR